MPEGVSLPEARTIVNRNRICIRNWFTGYWIGEWPGTSLREALELAVRLGADLEGADLRGARLEGANLTGARLTGANLRGANLSGARLWSAQLQRAQLAAAELGGAELVGADLTGANLRGANLLGADLAGADLSGIRLVGASLEGRRWFSYLLKSVPRLLTAAGRTMKEIVARRAFDSHLFGRCPISVAFEATSFADVPEEFREEAVLFTRLFDAHLIPAPEQGKAATRGAGPLFARRRGRKTTLPRRPRSIPMIRRVQPREAPREASGESGPPYLPPRREPPSSVL